MNSTTGDPHCKDLIITREEYEELANRVSLLEESIVLLLQEGLPALTAQVAYLTQVITTLTEPTP